MSTTDSLVLGLDLGTSYFKAALFDRSGSVQGLGRSQVHSDSLEGGRSELPVDRFLELVRGCIAQAMAQAGAGRERVVAMSYSSQANTFLLSDGEGEPLTPLVMWPDRRGAALLPELRRLTRRADFLEVTGLGVETPEFCVAKILWYQRHQPELWSRVSAVRTISDYLVEALTGLPYGDEGTASLLGLWNLQSHEWWSEALQTVGLCRPHLSTPLAPGAVAGRLTERGAGCTGLAPGIPLAVGSLDHHLAAVGAGIKDPRQVAVSLGTVAACLQYSDAYHPAGGCCMGRATHGHAYYRLAFDSNGTGALDWYGREHGSRAGFEELTSSAGRVGPGSDGLSAVPSPQLHGGLTGFLGASSRHGPGHYVRSIMESTAASVRLLLDRLRSGAAAETLVATGGGSRNALWLQIVADVSGLAVLVPDVGEPAARGAAMVAAVAAGWFPGLEAATDQWCGGARLCLPDPRHRAIYADWLPEYVQKTRCAPSAGARDEG